MATVLDAITYARQKNQTDSNGISDTFGLAWANNGLIDITRDFIARGVDAAQVQESYATLSPSDNPPGRFAWPSDMWALKTVEVDYTNTGGLNYIQAEKMDVANLQFATSFDFVRTQQPTNRPLFTNHGDTGEVFPTPQSATLIRIFYYLTPTEYTTTGSTINYPQALDYRALGDKISVSYQQSQGRFDIAQGWQAEYDRKMNDAINILAPQSKQPTKPDKLHITGFEF